MRPTFAITGPLGILAAYTCASALAAPLPPDEAVLACPQTAAQWSDWRQNLVSGLNAPEDLIDGRARAILECQSQPEQKAFFRDPGFAACMAPVQEALTAVKAIRDTDINDTGNFALLFKPALSHLGPDDNPEVEELPAFFLKPDFLKACVTKDLSNAAVRSIMRQLAAEHPGAETVQFKSRFGIGDESIVSRIPDRRYDRWIHLHRSSEGLTHFVIMLSIEKKDRTGKRLDPPRLFFSTFAVHPSVLQPRPSSSPPVSAEPPDGHDGMMMELMSGMSSAPPSGARLPHRLNVSPLSCFTCHRTGAVAVVPDSNDPRLISYTQGKSAQDVLSSFVRSISAQATAAPREGTIVPLGPEIGPVNFPGRTDAFMKTCTRPAQLPPASVFKIREAMNCASCHDDSIAGRLTFPLGGAGHGQNSGFTPANVFREMIVSGHMPSDSTLTGEERTALASCLIREYYGGFKRFDPEGSSLPQGLFLQAMVRNPCPRTIAAAQGQAEQAVKRMESGETSASEAAPRKSSAREAGK